MKPVAYFLCALALILICLSPWLILSYYEKLPETPCFEGILSFWHIGGWRTGGSSAAAFLQKRIEQYEAQNPHVFIEMKTLSAQQAADAVSNGETPDIVSYPYGLALSLDFAELPPQSTIFSGLSGDAYPYMCGGYCLLVNTDKAAENGIELPSGWGIRPDALAQTAALGVCFDSEPGFTSLPSLALHAYPEAARPQISTLGEPEPKDDALPSDTQWQEGFAAFCEGGKGVLIASHRQLFEASELFAQGDAPPFAAYAVGPYTDMVQMVGVAEQSDKLRQNAAESFAAFLLTHSTQKKLEALGVFPVIPDLEIYRQNDTLRYIYEQLCKGASVPVSAGKEKLDALAEAALTGDASAMRRLKRLLG